MEFGVNHYAFDESSVALLRALDPTRPVPARIEFNWQSIETIAGLLDFTESDRMVSIAARAGVPLLGIIGYSSVWASSIPHDFDLTEVAPFKVGWHSGTPTADFGKVAWGADDPQLGAVKYLWDVRTEDGAGVRRVAYLRPAKQGYIHGLLTLAVPQGRSVLLESKIGFLAQSPAFSRINFSITYQGKNGFPALLKVQKSLDGTIRTDTVDVTAWAGQTLNLFWNMESVPGFPAGDPILKEAKIIVDGTPYPMIRFLGDDIPYIVSYPPSDRNQFAKFAGALAARYPQIQAWEVWNEPNLSYYWRPAPDPAAYVDLLRAAHDAIKRANPSATVAMGGLSAVTGTGYADSILPDQFLTQIYRDSSRPFDVVAIHPYGTGAPQSYIEDSLERIESVISQYDTGRKIWVTEIGWSTQGAAAISESEQAGSLCQAREVFERFPSVERVYWYSLQDGSGSPLYPYQYYGLFHLDGTPKPAAGLFR